MQQEFEKQVNEKLHDYYLEPSNQVWKDIAVALKTPRKRRVFAWWIFSAAALIIGGTVWMFYGNIFSTETNTVSQKSIAETIIPFSEKNNGKNLSDAHSSLQQKNQADLSGIKNQIASSTSFPSKPANIDFNSRIFSSSNNNFTEKNNLKENISIVSDLSTNEVNDQTKVFSFNNIAPQKNILQPNSSLAENSSATVNKNKKSSKSVWSFLFAGGTTNTVSSDFLFRKKSQSIFTDRRGVSDTAKSMRAAYTGFHATVGIQYSLALNTHWKMYTGLQYSFLLNHQRTGQKVIEESEISTLPDTSFIASRNFTKIEYHYPDGTSAVNTNRASWLEMPVGFGYTLNPSSKHTKVELRAGGSFAHMFSNKWLVADGRYNKFYYSNALTNDMILNWHSDLVVMLPKNKVIGLQVQHSFTTFAKQSVQPALYWSNISLYTTIPLTK